MDTIQFLTRKEATCQDLLSCLYNLKPIDLAVFGTVAKKEWMTLDQIADKVERDRSSTHRSLAKLVSAGLIHKESKGLRGGGYYHVFAIVEPDKIKKHARERVKEVTESLETLIENFELDLKKHIAT